MTMVATFNASRQVSVWQFTKGTTSTSWMWRLWTRRCSVSPKQLFYQLRLQNRRDEQLLSLEKHELFTGGKFRVFPQKLKLKLTISLIFLIGIGVRFVFKEEVVPIAICDYMDKTG